ncbi:helix-turn-helix transcriptional regulator [Longimicrobium sp.]|uniref:helix-turn-helix domain-containing protein n=1 Tax=Longimicrobium sp. TaxID=2029185 RepID=UPI002E31FB35|nr:helix-turn-helix transcriptional regulator [Longimicrobium sp.]HEX6040090.1 helix-turn-helix transcriptional regulator [Longimicrobium sp.]
MSALSRAEILKRFGEAVREHRQRAGLSQEKLAARAGIDRTYVGGAERGERNVALVNIVRLAEALGIAPAELFSGLEDGKPETIG